MKVKLATLHQALQWPGTKLNSQITMHNKGDACPELKMTLLPQGLLIELRQGKCIVPYANVVNAVLADDEDPKESKAKK